MGKTLANDWRRQGQAKFLKSVELIFKKYVPRNTNWEHDHCEFCGAKFSLEEGALKNGYATNNDYHWICKLCFTDFEDEFDWVVRLDAS